MNIESKKLKYHTNMYFEHFQEIHKKTCIRIVHLITLPNIAFVLHFTIANFLK